MQHYAAIKEVIPCANMERWYFQHIIESKTSAIDASFL